MTQENKEINTHNLVCDFGRHNGELYTRLPVSYLTWMVNSLHSRSDIAQAELKRRGTVMPEMTISGHAIDRASLSCRKIWHETRGQDEGLHAWLVRITKDAIQHGSEENGKIAWGDLRLVVEMDGKWPVLKTIMNKGKKKGGEKCQEK